MVHFYDRKFIRCWITNFADGTSNRRLHIEYEFSYPGQQDGHGPWHGDDQRDFAECVIRNMETGPIMDCLAANSIKAYRIGDYNISVKALNKLGESYCPLYLMTIGFNLSIHEDSLKFMAESLLGSIKWEVAKEAIYYGESSHNDWEWGRKGNVWSKKQELIKIAAEKLRLVTPFPEHPFVNGLTELQSQMLDDAVRTL